MTFPMALAEREQKTGGATRRRKRGSVSEILRASYRRFTRDQHTRQAVSRYLRQRDGR